MQISEKKEKNIPKFLGMKELLPRVVGLYQLGVLDVSERNACAKLIKEGMHKKESKEQLYRFLFNKKTEKKVPMLNNFLELLENNKKNN